MDRERKDLKVRLAEMVSRVQWAFLGQEDHLVPLGRTEIRENSESLARRALKVTRASTVHQALPDHRDLLERPVLLVQMESPAPEVSRVCLVRRETKDPEDSLGPPARLDCRACLDPRARKERPETLDKWDPPDLLAPEDHPVPLELTGRRDPLVASETLALWERRETQGRLASLVFKEKSVHRAPGESAERRERLVRLVQLDPLDQRDPLEMTVLKAALVRVASLVTQDLPESLVQLD